jgi:hypothetical protein
MYMCYQTFNGSHLMILLSCTESNYIFCKCKQNIHQTAFCIQDAIWPVSKRQTCLSICIASSDLYELLSFLCPLLFVSRQTYEGLLHEVLFGIYKPDHHMVPWQ